MLKKGKNPKSLRYPVAPFQRSYDHQYNCIILTHLNNALWVSSFNFCQHRCTFPRNKLAWGEGKANNKLAFYCATKRVLARDDKLHKKENIWNRLC